MNRFDQLRSRFVPTLLASSILVIASGNLRAQSDSDGLGGIHDVRLEILDASRFRAEFGGDTIDVRFLPIDLVPLPDREITYSEILYYHSEVVVRSRRRNAELMRFFVDYSVDGELVFSDRTVSPASSDVRYAGRFVPSPDRPVNGTVGIYDGIFGVSFDFEFLQGDTLRFGPPGGTAAEAFTRQTASDINLVPYSQHLGTGSLDDPGAYISSIPSYGRPHLDVEVLACEGCTETLTIQKHGRTYTYPDVPYLTLAVRNDASFVRVDEATGERDTVRYDFEYELDEWSAVTGDTAKHSGTIVRLTDVDSYGLYAYGWLDLNDATQRSSPIQRARFTATSPVRPVGTPGRYYLGRVAGTDDEGGQHLLAFTHRLIVNGAEIFLDFAGMGSPEAPVRPMWVPEVRPTVELSAGDRFEVEFSGGTLGLPEPGATVAFAVSQLGGLDVTKSVTRSIVSVSPNPVRDVATIDLHVGESGAVRLRIVSADGRVVATLCDEHLSSGDYRFTWDRGDHAAGMYYYQAVTPAGTETGPLQVR